MPSTHKGYKVENLECPEQLQERIRDVGGLNRYDEPNFKLVWAQTCTTRQGGEWEALGEQYRGYRDVHNGDGLPHWQLMQWVDAGKSLEMPHLPAQSDVAFYAENECPKTGLQILGGYPYHGSYRVALPLVAKWFQNGQMFVRAFPISAEVVSMMIPVIKASMEVSVEAKMRFYKEQQEQEDDQYAVKVEDAWKDSERKASLASTAWLEDKQRSIERHFNAGLIARMQRDRRIQSQNRI